MPSFPASDLQRNPAEIQKAALMGPVFLTYHDKPRYVMMSLDAFVRLRGKDATAQLSAYPQDVAARIRELAKASAGAGGKPDAAAVDKLVLATVNAPYKRNIDAATLRHCLLARDPEPWLVHVATFFTDVAPELVFEFAARHGISRSRLAQAYRAVKRRTGERNRVLEADLAELAPSHRANRRRPRAPTRKRRRGA